MPKPLSTLLAATSASSIVVFINAIPASAATLLYDFTVQVRSGILAGETFSGWFSFDDVRLSQVGEDVFTVADDNLRIEFSFLGTTFDQDDESFELFERALPLPRVTFRDGELIGLNYRVDEVRGSNLTPIPDPVQDFTILGSGFGYRTNDDVLALDGTVSYALKTTPESITPIALIAAGMLSVGLQFGCKWARK